MKNNTNLSVIIPCHNNEEIIQQTIRRYNDQTLPRDKYELIVVDDGSSDQTANRIKELQPEIELTLIENANRGASSARNTGAKAARNDILFFTQDDIFADSNLLKKHWDFHQTNPDQNYCMVGYTTWDPLMKITPFMYWLEHGGPQFDYDGLKENTPYDHLAFYTPNVSLKRQFFADHEGFDESFRGPAGLTAYEDTELGWRLMKSGMQLYYNPDAIALHHDKKDLAKVLKRRYLEGKMLKLLYAKHPDFSFEAKLASRIQQLKKLKTDFIPDKWRTLLTRYIINPVTVWPFEKAAYYLQDKLNIPLIFKIVCGYHYNRGINNRGDN